MEQDPLAPEAIVIFSAGIVRESGGAYRSTTFAESDAFGMLGGRDRVEAAALLAERYPRALLVTTSRQLGGTLPTLAQVYADELRALGVDDARILELDDSSSTGTCVSSALALAAARGWRRIALLSSEYHLPRIAAFVRRASQGIEVSYVSAEDVLVAHDASRAAAFDQIRESAEYTKRLAAEAAGIAALEEGRYHAAPAADKRERTL